MPTAVSPMLSSLKVEGPQTTLALAKALGVTRQAARQQLERLEADGLVRFATERAGVGRPRRVWTITAAGHARFPDGHADALTEILRGVRAEFGEAGLSRVVGHREAAMRQAYRSQLADRSSWRSRLAGLAEVRTEEGYMAETIDRSDGSALLIENHCPICAAASECQGFCRSELAIFQELLGPEVEVTRTEHALTGARRCAYEVRPRLD